MKRTLVLFVIGLALIATTGSSAHSTPQQDPTFRLLNVERRLDQLQTRVDFVERAVQNQSSQTATGSSFANQAVLDLQRQQLSLAEQLVTMQRQMLEMQKTIDRLTERERDAKPKETPKPKTTPSKP